MSHVRIGGTWREFDKVWVKIGGIWREVDKVFSNIGGTWREGWKNEQEFLVFVEGNTVKKYNLDGTFSASRSFSETLRSIEIGPENTIYINYISGTSVGVYVLNSDLQTIQTSDTFVPTSLPGVLDGYIAVGADGEVIFGNIGRSLVRLNSNGSLKYNQTVGFSDNLFRGKPVIDKDTGDTIIVFSSNSRYYRRYTKDGTTMLFSVVMSYTADKLVVLNNGSLYGVGSTSINDIDKTTGTNSRRYNHTSTGTFGSFRTPACAGINESGADYVYIGTGRGNDREGGRIASYRPSGAGGGISFGNYVVHPGEDTLMVAVDNKGDLYSSGADLTVRKTLGSSEDKRTLAWSHNISQSVYHMAVTPGLIGTYPEKFNY